MASFYRIKTIFDYEVIVDKRDNLVVDSISSLEFSLVDFSYSKKKRVLEDVSFKIDNNMTLGIIGFILGPLILGITYAVIISVKKEIDLEKSKENEVDSAIDAD